MAKTDTMGLLTGIPSGGIDPMTAGSSFAQRQLQYGADRARGLQRAIGGMRGQQPAAEQIARAYGQKRKTQKNAFGDYLEKQYPNSGLKELAIQGVVTPDNLSDFVGGADATARQGKRYTVRDEQGNMYAMTTRFDNATGSFDTLYAPIGLDTPSQPSGQITILTEEGITFQEKEEIKIATSEAINSAETFKEAQLGALSERFNIADSLSNINRAIELLESTPTGGPIRNVSAGLAKFLGTTPSDRAELEYLLAKQVLNNLKSTFGGVISEGERQYLLDISANITRGNKANLAIFNNLRKIQERAAKRNDLLLNSTNYEDYVETIKGYKFEDFKTSGDGDTKGVIDFNDLIKD